MAATRKRELFGGAITATLPASLIDASDLRQIPDTQEVFLYPDSGISIIIEVLQCVDAKESTDIAKFHFDSLAHDNDATEHKVLTVSTMPDTGSGSQTPIPVVLTGIQLVRKFNQASPDELRVLLAVYRVKEHNVDLVMSMNVPTKSFDGGAIREDELTTAQDTFSVAARSLQIIDFGLFA